MLSLFVILCIWLHIMCNRPIPSFIAPREIDATSHL